jgi:hypothetical protein
MSQETAIVAVAQPAVGKLDQVRRNYTSNTTRLIRRS